MKTLLIALLLACSMVCARAETVAQYSADLQTVRQQVDAEAAAVSHGPPLPGQTAAGMARRLLLPIKLIQDHDGTVYAFDARPIVAKIMGAEAAKGAQRADQLRAVSRSLGELAAAASMPNPARTPSQSKASVRAVLSRPEFQSQPAPDPSFFERMGARIAKWIEDHWPKMKTPTGPSWSPNIHVIWGILIALAVGLFALLVWLIVGAVGRRSARAKPLAADDTEAAFVEARDTDSILDLADTKARAGDFRGAFRLVYLATLVALDTGGILRFDRSKTNWEYLRSLRAAGRGDIYEMLQPLTRDFDRLWYGFATAGPEDYQRARREYQRLTEAEPSRSEDGAEARTAGAAR